MDVIVTSEISSRDVIVAPLTAVVTKAVVAIWVVLVPPAAVGASGVPVSDGEASGAKPEIDAPEGIVTVPVKVGLASGALVSICV